MQDKTIDNVLRHLHRECMNGRHDGMMWVLALMHLRGVKPDYRKSAERYGSRRARRVRKFKSKPSSATHP